MKQLLSLALALIPCLAWAQYPSNGNQKITLGEQTTADGLIWRGVLADTGIITPSSDTSAYIILDTVNNRFYNYNRTTNVWSVAGGGTAVTSITGGTGLTGGTITSTGTLAADTNFLVTRYDTTSMLTPYIERGDTASMLLPYFRKLDTTNISYVNTYGTQTVNGAKTFSAATTFNNTITGTKFIPASGGNATGNGMFLSAANTLGFSTNGTEKIRIASNGRVGIGTTTLTGILNIKEVGAELTISSDANNVYFEGINRENTALNVDYGFYARNGSHKFWTGSYSERMRLTNDGELLINYTTDNGAYPLQVNGQIFATNVTIATSDIKFKENITPLNKGLEIVNKLKPVTFNFKNDTENNFSEYEEVGFIAQDVDRVLSTETFAKSIVKASDDTDSNSTMGLATQNLIPILVKAIQEQNQLIKQLEQRIINLENK